MSTIEQDRIFQHRLDATQMVRGQQLEPGEKMEKGDVYDCITTAKWEPIPLAFIGSPVSENRAAVIVRLTKRGAE